MTTSERLPGGRDAGIFLLGDLQSIPHRLPIFAKLESSVLIEPGEFVAPTLEADLDIVAETKHYVALWDREGAGTAVDAVDGKS